MLWDAKHRDEIIAFYDQNPIAWEKWKENLQNAEDYRLMAHIQYGNYVIPQSQYL